MVTQARPPDLGGVSFRYLSENYRLPLTLRRSYHRSFEQLRRRFQAQHRHDRGLTRSRGKFERREVLLLSR